ncbi:MAG TPA: hypothetical protein VE987_08660, partial [Polyangiaceae bacterium]|nr:hypothetical protein [Polyangiaceae bacterium]
PAAFLIHFDGTKGQLPEGLWKLGDAGTPIVGLAPLATLVTVSADGGAETFGAVGEAGTAVNTFTLGITTDVAGNVYAGIGSLMLDAGPAPAPGVYKFPPGGGAGTLFSSDPGMNFPNGLTFIGSSLFVADSYGAVYVIDAQGTASVWSSDALLAPDPTACSGSVPLPIGANGLVHDANNVYVSNTNHGRIVKIPMSADGGAGTASVLVEDCAALAGADGVVLDTKDGSLIVAVNVQNKIVRVSTGDGGTSVVTSGPPLDSPASVLIDSVPDGGRRLLFTNAAFFSAADAGRPGLLALPIP